MYNISFSSKLLYFRLLVYIIYNMYRIWHTFKLLHFRLLLYILIQFLKKRKVSYRGGRTKELSGFKYKIIRWFLFKYTIIKKKNVDFNRNY